MDWSRPFLAASALAALGALLALSGCATTGEGRKAPPVKGDRWLLLEGKDAPAVVHGHWSLVVFFRSRIRACDEGMAALVEIATAHREAGLVTVAVTPDGAGEAKEFIRRHALPFPVLAEANAVLDAWGVPEAWANRVCLLDPAGVVLAEDDLPATRRILAKYLGK